MISVLTDYLAKLGKVSIAYWGVDSTFLVAVSARVLYEGNVLAVTVQLPLTPLWGDILRQGILPYQEGSNTFCSMVPLSLMINA